VVLRQGTSAPVANPSPLPSPIVRVSSANVTALTITGKDKAGSAQTLTLKRAGGAWSYALCPPLQADCPSQSADSGKATSLVDTVVTLRPSKTIFGAPDGLPAYGLDTPSTAEVDISTASGQLTVLWVGAKGIDKTSYFVRLKDTNDVYAVDATAIDSTILDALTNPPKVQPSPSPNLAPPSPSPSPIVGPVASP
jgi:hypothetical protein